MNRFLIVSSFIGTLSLSFIGSSEEGFKVIYDKQLTGSTLSIQIAPGLLHSFTYSIDSLADLDAAGPVRIRIQDDQALLLEKTLASGDADFYSLFRPQSKAIQVTLSPGASRLPRSRLKIVQWNLPRDAVALFESEPNDSWKQADPIELGKTVWAGGDDQPYLPLSGDEQNAASLMETGVDWYSFEYAGEPRLVFFGTDLLDRDNIPVDVSVFREENGELHAYEEGADPVTPPHEVQALPGNKFTTRVMTKPGRYYVRVFSRHPLYQLRTELRAAPPYDDPREAVRTALDYILGAGDSWHANTPRKGGVYDRIANYHHETSLCVACHPTHFSLRAQAYALRNGYAVRQRPQVLFLTERFYNNPLPFYGQPETALAPARGSVSPAVWTRVISAPANVLSRMAVLLQIFEKELKIDHRRHFFEGIGEYLKLYYKGRDELPPDETNGNRPLVSTFEVAWYSWEVLDDLYQRTRRPEYEDYCDRLRRMIEAGEVKNMIDLGYQTLAFCSIDRQAYQDRIRQNAERILSYQRPSGQWAATFVSEDPEAEFQTGHCLWALAEAGYTSDHPAVAKGIRYLLNRQQNFGGWFDPLQSYENFRTPFRETQMAVLALSRFYPEKQRRGDGSVARLTFERPDQLLLQLNDLWEPLPEAVFKDTLKAAAHPEPYVRAAALTCLGRVGEARAASEMAERLGDPTKIVQRSAAWALRSLYSRKHVGGPEIGRGFKSANDRVRWGTTRIFAHHFSGLANNTILAESLLRLADDPVPGIRIQALKGLWQLWYWSADQKIKSRIEDAFLLRLGVEEDPRVLRNVREGIYILADENIRYLYNNWIPSLAVGEDRDRAVLTRLSIESRLAGKFAKILQSDNRRLRHNLLAALSDFHLRSPQSYLDLKDESGPAQKPRPATLFTRIGNDIETVKFFGESADLFARALAPLLRSNGDSTDRAVRLLAARLAYAAREDRIAPDYGSTRKYGLADVVRLAGPYDQGRRLLAEEMLHLLGDEDAEIRQIAADVRKSFTPEVTEANRARLASLLKSLLDSSYSEAQTEALEIVHVLGLQSFPSLLEDREVRLKILRSLGSSDLKIFQAALELALNTPELERDPMILRRLKSVFTSPEGEKKKAILELAGSKPVYLKDLRIVSLLSEALIDPDPSVSRAALALVKKEDSLQGIPAVAAALAKLPGQSASLKVKLPDYQFFKERVQPILETPGKDGNACVNCHQTHSILRLTPPGPSGTTEEQIQEHYRSALRVIDLQNPQESLILKKPTSTAESEGILSPTPTSHGGGQRWEKSSPPYQTLLQWITGVRD